MWAAFMNAHFKKQGGGKYLPTDLIRLSFDKKEEQVEKPSLDVFEKLVERHGKRRRRNGK
jgi:hypothetical protein